MTLPNHAKTEVIDKAYEPLRKHKEAEPQGLNTSKILFQVADLGLQDCIITYELDKVYFRMTVLKSLK